MRSISILLITASLNGCKDESNPKMVEYKGPIALRANYARPTVFKLSTKQPDGKLKITSASCDDIDDRPPSSSGKYQCYIMKGVTKKMRSDFATMARFVLTKKDPFEVNGRTAGTVVDRIDANIISLHRNQFELIRDGPDVCIQVVSANVAFVKNDAYPGILANKPTKLLSSQFPVDWMTFGNAVYLYNFVDFTDSRTVEERLKVQVPELFDGSQPNQAWSMKASRHFTVRVCQSTIDHSVIVDNGVIFKIAID